MSFEITTQTNGLIVEITLSGDLDGSVAPRLQETLEAIAAGKPTALVLHTRDLLFIASAGIRMLIFAKRKMGGEALTVYVVAPREQVLDTLVRTGVRDTVVVLDQYPAAT